MKPRPRNPSNIMAQGEGSGTAETSVKLDEGYVAACTDKARHSSRMTRRQSVIGRFDSVADPQSDTWKGGKFGRPWLLSRIVSPAGTAAGVRTAIRRPSFTALQRSGSVLLA